MAVSLHAADGPGMARFTCVPRDSDLLVTGVVEATDHGIVITSMEFSTQAPSGITATTNRSFRLGELLAYLRTARELDETRRALGLHQSAAEPTAVSPETTLRPRRGGRPAVGDETLRALAVAYLEECAHGKPAGSVARVASRFGRPEETIRTWLARARKEGWLTAGVRGRRGAEAGPRLREEKA
jgi:hypothetical protein